MVVKDIHLKLDSAVSEAENTLNKARIVTEYLGNGYFGKSEPEDWLLRAFYNDAKIKNAKVNDYLYELEGHLKEIRTILDTTITSKGEEHEPGTD